jgi:hypothetical protein
MPYTLFLEQLTRLFRAGVITATELCVFVIEEGFEVYDIGEDEVVFSYESQSMVCHVYFDHTVYTKDL